ncbi:16S rRNA methyltransferase G [Candidatus Epulonipiscium fishelsonii]|uniref:16S rRNA methyltransferase G n=1 Tax=Candidatus Epulonipiscium fishelsonii TaxID=77094 RepID=A0ACC8XAN3_9FIRM|nr:16S rRNA methyltransferase G [Epulopiscium sp. SCG-B11WGA-EpuloA1]ONI40141.1 16S rRNA methyltransferase G [Epulopiscium sp. SCG-B05WGA-EpuloA1]ONI47999.1 16S rRNA methyltransferase G [Epulopiscium sp. SCG-C06WGA-EpuloA1]
MLKTGAQQIGINLSENQINQFMLYKDILVEWNKKINLTTIVDDDEIIKKHFLDCITIAKSVDLSKVNTLIDVGTGAGFPGIVIKIICPNIKVTLVDSLNKRIKFLNVVIQELGLENIECIHSRAEDLGKNPSYREKFDLCASRAVAQLAVLSEYTLPFVKVGGTLVALKGPSIEEELPTGKKAINILGGKLDKIIDITVPFTQLNHKIVTIKKVRHTDKIYPRQAGLLKKNPLGQ